MLIDAYQEVDDGDGRCLEYVYWDRLKRLRLPTFGEFPDIVGISATNNEPYTLAKGSYERITTLLRWDISMFMRPSSCGRHAFAYSCEL